MSVPEPTGELLAVSWCTHKTSSERCVVRAGGLTIEFKDESAKEVERVWVEHCGSYVQVMPSRSTSELHVAAGGDYGDDVVCVTARSGGSVIESYRRSKS